MALTIRNVCNVKSNVKEINALFFSTDALTSLFFYISISTYYKREIIETVNRIIIRKV